MCSWFTATPLLPQLLPPLPSFLRGVNQFTDTSVLHVHFLVINNLAKYGQITQLLFLILQESTAKDNIPSFHANICPRSSWVSPLAFVHHLRQLPSEILCCKIINMDH